MSENKLPQDALLSPLLDPSTGRIHPKYLPADVDILIYLSTDNPNVVCANRLLKFYGEPPITKAEYVEHLMKFEADLVGIDAVEFQESPADKIALKLLNATLIARYGEDIFEKKSEFKEKLLAAFTGPLIAELLETCGPFEKQEILKKLEKGVDQVPFALMDIGELNFYNAVKVVIDILECEYPSLWCTPLKNLQLVLSLLWKNLLRSVYVENGLQHHTDLIYEVDGIQCYDPVTFIRETIDQLILFGDNLVNAFPYSYIEPEDAPTALPCYLTSRENNLITYVSDRLEADNATPLTDKELNIIKLLNNDPSVENLVLYWKELQKALYHKIIAIRAGEDVLTPCAITITVITDKDSDTPLTVIACINENIIVPRVDIFETAFEGINTLKLAWERECVWNATTHAETVVRPIAVGTDRLVRNINTVIGDLIEHILAMAPESAEGMYPKYCVFLAKFINKIADAHKINLILHLKSMHQLIAFIIANSTNPIEGSCSSESSKYIDLLATKLTSNQQQ